MPTMPALYLCPTRPALDATANRGIIYRGAWGCQGASFLCALGQNFTTGRGKVADTMVALGVLFGVVDIALQWLV
ncbi:unnamed protein product [Penicillium camemberti]|uniref:Str. FM013 n=1 Tax=Penicillium camemberti (strain FM 013) TaxID=1429867 RepID=A0A0G4PPM8_PENC3|nr:unnamed protein product [Penicillium camemberti]